MVNLDWKRILSIRDEKLADDEKEDLLEPVTTFMVTEEVSKEQLIALLKVAQMILKFKAEQVDSLMAAVDELAAKQGEDEAKSRQELLEEIETLQAQLEYQKRLDRESGFSDDEMKIELERLEIQNEEIVLEVQERERELIVEKAAVERLSDKVARLERERAELVRELDACREESAVGEHRRDSGSIGGSSEKIEELMELVRQKNKHLMQLLDDVTTLESTNSGIQLKLTAVQDQLKESNSNLTDRNNKIAQLNVSLSDKDVKIKELSDCNKALTAQIDELISKREKNEQHLDEFAAKLNERVEEWKQILDNKDREISKLREELLSVAGKGLSTYETSVNGRAHNQQLAAVNLKMKAQISELLSEKEHQMKVVKDLQGQLERNASNKDEGRIQELECQVKDLETQLETLAIELEGKCEEISELITQLRTYEQGQFGLSEALDKIKNLEKKVADKNKQIEKLVAFSNDMEVTTENGENGAPPDQPIQSNNVLVISELKNQVEKLNSEIIDLKMKNRQLSKHPVSEKPKSAKNVNPEVELKYHLLMEENDSLRKGLHDVLHSIKSESMGEIQVTSLERLLEALDARHISGWYHPAMRLQAQLNTLQGEANELRNRVRTLTEENQRLVRDNGATLPWTPRTQAMNDNSPEQAQKEDQTSDKHAITQENTEILLEEERMKFEQAFAAWEKERCCLLREREGLQTKLAELGHEDFVDVYSSAREGELERELDDVRSRWYQTREKLLKENIMLRMEKSTLLSQMNKMKHELNLSMSPDQVHALEGELASLRIMYNEEISQKAFNSGSELPLHRLTDKFKVLLEHVNQIKSDDQLGKIKAIMEDMKEEFEKTGRSNYGETVGASWGSKFREILDLEIRMKAETTRIFKCEVAWKDQCMKNKAEIATLREFLKMYRSLYRAVVVDKLHEQEGCHHEDADEFNMMNECAMEEPIASDEPLPSTAEVLFNHLQIMYQHLGKLHATFQNALCFPNLELACNTMVKIKQQLEETESNLRRVQERECQVAAKEEELDIQLRSVHEMKCALQSDASILVTWHNKVTEFSLIEARYKRQNTQLLDRVSDLEQQVRDGKQELASLKAETLEREQGWTEMQRQWADAQIELFKILSEKASPSKIEFNSGDKEEMQERLGELQMQNKALIEELKQKDAVFAEIIASRTQMEARNVSPITKPVESKPIQLSYNVEDTKGCVVTSSLASLRAIIQQKEEQIQCYQLLLQKSHEEKDETMRRMEKDLRNLHVTLAQQSKAYSRIQLGINKPQKTTIERYVKKIQDLEEELNETQISIKKLTKMLDESNGEAEHWRRAVVEQERSSEETRERMEIQIENLHEELSKSHQEAEKWRDMAHGDKVLLNKINELQAQLVQQQIKQPEYSNPGAHDGLASQLRSSREECARLRKQLAAISVTKARPHSGWQENPVEKIRKLEEMLQLSKKHEQELEANGIKRIRSAEEVTRWDERKRHQKSLEKLNTALKQKEVEAEVANKKLETLRGLMTKVEREKNQLLSQVKVLTARERCALGTIIEDKSQLREQISLLEEEMNRKDVDGALEQSKVRNASEIDFFMKEVAILKKHNFDLEKENLACKVLIEKLQVEIQKTDLHKPTRHSARYAYDTQRQLSQAKDENNRLKNEINSLNEQNVALRDQLQRLQTKLLLWEEKDTADTIAKEKQEECVSELLQELNRIKVELHRKSHLLGRVKVLLCRAAAKEKALNEKVSALQSKNSCCSLVASLKQ